MPEAKATFEHLYFFLREHAETSARDDDDGLSVIHFHSAYHQMTQLLWQARDRLIAEHQEKEAKR